MRPCLQRAETPIKVVDEARGRLEQALSDCMTIPVLAGKEMFVPNCVPRPELPCVARLGISVRPNGTGCKARIDVTQKQFAIMEVASPQTGTR